MDTGEGCHFLLQGDFPVPAVEVAFLMLPALAGVFFTTSATSWNLHDRKI